MNTQPFRIMVVDDSDFIQEGLSYHFTSSGYEVLIAGNGQEALSLLEKEGPVGLIVSDLNMPLMNGVELRDEMLKKGIQIPFILATGNPELMSDQARAELKINALLIKPYAFEELDSIVENFRHK